MQIQSIDSLTPEVFGKILSERWKPKLQRKSHPLTFHVPQIQSLSVERVEQGVLSQVYKVLIKYFYKENELQNIQKHDDHQEVIVPATNWLVKLCRHDLNLNWMCQNETNFYSRVVPLLLKIVNGSDNEEYQTGREYDNANISKALPFNMPDFLTGDDQYLILQEITNVRAFSLLEGCPTDKIPFLFQTLAAWHAKCWKHPIIEQVAKEYLVFPPGMGQKLSSLQKEGLFVTSWQNTINHLGLKVGTDDELLQFITDLCQNLASRKLRTVHENVHQHRVTLVHGDFHIANWLFPESNATGQTPVLVDWATAGYGNPMIDFVFFLVVSTNYDIVSKSQNLLKEYYHQLVEHNPSVSQSVDLEMLQDWFAQALILQWTILVAYDDLCIQIALGEKDTVQRESQLKHFKNVNRRAVLALKSIHNWDSILSGIVVATVEEQEEAQRFCQETDLTI